MKDYTKILKNCVSGNLVVCKLCPYHNAPGGCVTELMRDVVQHIQIKDNTIECMNITHNGDVQEIHRLRLENEELQLENRILSQKRISFPERLEITNKARLSGARDYVKQLKTKIYGYDVMWSTESIYYTMNKLLKEWEENTNE